MKTPNEWAKRCHQLLIKFITHTNTTFHQLPAKSKRSLLLVVGLLMAFSCLTVLMQSITGRNSVPKLPDRITQPPLMFPNNKIIQPRSIIGKLHVIIHPDTLLFDVAANTSGDIFIKADSSQQPANGSDAQQWHLISLTEWSELIRQFRFIPDSTHQ
jgi:hypothetical protein